MKTTISRVATMSALILILGASSVFAGGAQEVPAMMNDDSAGMMMDSPPVPPPAAMGGDYMKPDAAKLKSMLTDLQYRVTQEDWTERPFANEYFDSDAPGIYVDVVSGEPLFSSKAKYHSGTGWPSFWQPLEPGNIVLKQDTSHGMVRTEVRSYYGDSHLGHLFKDGPQPTGLRYCMNSASLRFIPVDQLEAEGYGEYLSLFDQEGGMK